MCQLVFICKTHSLDMCLYMCATTLERLSVITLDVAVATCIPKELTHFDTNRRYNPTLLIDIENRQILWDFQTETDFANPWARQHFVCKIEGRSSMILLKRNGTFSRVVVCVVS